jgi:hypothetical protein
VKAAQGRRTPYWLYRRNDRKASRCGVVLFTPCGASPAPTRGRGFLSPLGGAIWGCGHGVKVEFDLGLGFGALVVEVGGLIAPVADGA